MNRQRIAKEPSRGTRRWGHRAISLAARGRKSESAVSGASTIAPGAKHRPLATGDVRTKLAARALFRPAGGSSQRLCRGGAAVRVVATRKTVAKWQTGRVAPKRAGGGRSSRPVQSRRAKAADQQKSLPQPLNGHCRRVPSRRPRCATGGRRLRGPISNRHAGRNEANQRMMREQHFSVGRRRRAVEVADKYPRGTLAAYRETAASGSPAKVWAK